MSPPPFPLGRRQLVKMTEENWSTGTGQKTGDRAELVNIGTGRPPPHTTHRVQHTKDASHPRLLLVKGVVLISRAKTRQPAHAQGGGRRVTGGKAGTLFPMEDARAPTHTRAPDPKRHKLASQNQHARQSPGEQLLLLPAARPHSPAPQLHTGLHNLLGRVSIFAEARDAATPF